ncbi:Tripartite tricarboxylate transporter TctB family protein [Rhodovulum sp. ES.010]|uniref:tripartite tricarboxylate transporter TctB family protein n=1 Tax=Rhodovulum sp. ES.010 TaxID=1882821 RepID=UPI00092AF4DF|nr:tripartite tricarboxylate transporter TctB family protein [Rhodovulum sp. ES.010]SIO48446.1 Tripartite tricarboxylate transporter TctB family protein [Rhodovulum sp. ES.010]
MGVPSLEAERRQDVIAGSVLLLFAVAWTVAVWLSVPPGFDGVGPRAFPLWLGVGLGVLSALLLAKGLRGAYPPDEVADPDERPAAPVSTGLRLGLVVAVCAIIAGFGFLMQKIGFVPATVLTVAATLVFVLGERRPLVVGGMAFGIAFGAWLAFGKLLGAYMPPGTWISLF